MYILSLQSSSFKNNDLRQLASHVLLCFHVYLYSHPEQCI